MENIIIKKQLENRIDKNLLDKLLKEYKEVKGGFFFQDWEKVGIHAGKFCEISIAILKYLKTGEITNLNSIKFGEIYHELINMPKQTSEDEVVTLIIPRIIRSAYTIRNKRSIAHIKDIDPSYLDCTFLTAVCNWVMSEFLRLCHTSDTKTINNLISGLIERKVHIIEEFGEDIIILEPSLSGRVQILFILYHFYPKFVNEENLSKFIKNKTRANIMTSLRNLEKDGLVYRKSKECKLTKRGIKNVEEQYRELSDLNYLTSQ